MTLLHRIFVLFLCVLCLSLFKPTSVYSQNCDYFFPLVKGAEYELETYSPKQKKTGKIVYVVEDANKNGNKTEAQMVNQFYDEKDRLS